MRKTASVLISSISLLYLISACVSGGSAQDKRNNIDSMRAETLATLYATNSSIEGEVQDAIGYGVFSNVGINLILFSAGGGWGVVRDTVSGHDTYMRMASGGLGFGLGVKDFRGVFVFTSRNALDQFVDSGWDASLQADAAAVSGDKGAAFQGAIDVAPGIKLYQITETGLALQATIQGTRFWSYAGLN